MGEAEGCVGGGGTGGCVADGGATVVGADDGADELGADELGADEPGADEPGADEPGADEPGADDDGAIVGVVDGGELGGVDPEADAEVDEVGVATDVDVRLDGTELAVVVRVVPEGVEVVRVVGSSAVVLVPRTHPVSPGKAGGGPAWSAVVGTVVELVAVAPEVPGADSGPDSPSTAAASGPAASEVVASPAMTMDFGSAALRLSPTAAPTATMTAAAEPARTGGRSRAGRGARCCPT